MVEHTSILYLIPIPIAEGELNTLSPLVGSSLLKIKHYFVEDIRTARRFIKSVHPQMVIEELIFSLIDKHSGVDFPLFKMWVKEGHNIGIMSEAGCPCIADPGSEIVALAHDIGIKVIPIVGPDSIILALMASGLNGQSFCFRGYLPVKEPARSKKIKELENISAKENQTQIFIETPYRNDNLLTDLIKNCKSNTRICVAQNITAPDMHIKTKSINVWANNPLLLGKAPTVFLMMAV